MAFRAYWVFPVISGVVWLGMLLGLLIHWVVDTRMMIYPSMEPGQTIAYISDVGAAELKPLFVAGCVITTIFLDLSFAFDRWLRHRGRLVPNTSRGEKILSGITIFWAFIGTVGLTFLSGFDTAHYKTLHDVFLLFFIVGYLFSAIFICWEYQRLEKKNRQFRILRVSFWIKLVFVVVELLLAIAFIATNFLDMWNTAAILEWTIAFIFSFYIFSFAVDLWPARKGDYYSVRTKHSISMAEAGHGHSRLSGEGTFAGNGHGHGHRHHNTSRAHAHF